MPDELEQIVKRYQDEEGWETSRNLYRDVGTLAKRLLELEVELGIVRNMQVVELPTISGSEKVGGTAGGE